MNKGSNEVGEWMATIADNDLDGYKCLTNDEAEVVPVLSRAESALGEMLIPSTDYKRTRLVPTFKILPVEHRDIKSPLNKFTSTGLQQVSSHSQYTIYL